jgi:peptidoglycan DL-endopeptidase CwlO
VIRLIHAAGALATAALCVACASSGAVPRPFPSPGPEPVAVPDVAGPALQSALVGTALSLRGTPYRNGGSDPSGFDCSGFVAYVFAQQGFAVPRTVIQQSTVGRSVDRDAIQPGDLLFFRIDTSGPSHVAIAISPSEFVHAPSSSGVVRVEPLGASYWSSRFAGVRRYP